MERTARRWNGTAPFITSHYSRFAKALNKHMTDTPASIIRQLAPGETDLMRELLNVFGEAFDEIETYTGQQPSENYLEGLLESDTFIAVVAMSSLRVVGGLAAYELKKFERERSEIYIYDLAVGTAYRRDGIATALINELKSIAAQRAAHVVFVQADRTDPPAICVLLEARTARRRFAL